MELLALWAVAGILLVSAIVFGYVTIATRPLASHLERRVHPSVNEDLVRQACAHLDDEYRQLLNH